MKKVRLRYAPSPTGHLHIGNARTAIFCYLWAKHYNGDFIIRIEDTDLERNIEGGIESQLKWLEWLGIQEDESIRKQGNYGPYIQTKRLDIYKKYVDILLENGFAYYSFETAQEIDIKREKAVSNNKAYIHRGSERELSLEDAKNIAKNNSNYSIRFKVQDDEQYNFTDIVRGEVKTTGKDISDFVIMKNNGIPTYNFACVIDDHLMDISHVLRGEEHISNTPKQLMIYSALNWESPIYSHASLIVNENRKKLSKRDEDVVQFVEQYANLGYLPSALFNFISLLGWTPSTNDEVFTKEDIIEIFDEKRLVKSPSFFDVKKLMWMNQQHIKALSNEEYIKIAKKQLNKDNVDISKEKNKWLEEILLIIKESITTLNEISENYLDLTSNQKVQENVKEFYNNDISQKTISEFKRLISETSDYSIENIKVIINKVKENTGNKGKNLFMPIRLYVSGREHGPELPLIIRLKYTK